MTRIVAHISEISDKIEELKTSKRISESNERMKLFEERLKNGYYD